MRRSLGRGEFTTPPRLGVTLAPRHVALCMRRAVGLPDLEGRLIREVTDDSPASRAGLAAGDLIVTAGGQPARTIDDLFDALQAAGSGTIELILVRGTEERAVQVVLGDGT
jgi:serine protease Do